MLFKRREEHAWPTVCTEHMLPRFLVKPKLLRGQMNRLVLLQFLLKPLPDYSSLRLRWTDCQK